MFCSNAMCIQTNHFPIPSAEKFRRGRYDLLKTIQRSTRSGGAQASLQDQQREMDSLRNQVSSLEKRVHDLEASIQSRVETFMMEVIGQSRQQQLHPSLFPSQMGSMQGMSLMPQQMGIDTASAMARVAARSFGSVGNSAAAAAWENPLLGAQAARAFSTASGSDDGAGGNGGATLPPHPKQKNLPPVGAMPNASNTASILNSVPSASFRGMSTASLRNGWDEKIFNSLLMSEGASRAASLASFNQASLGGGAGLAAYAAAQQMQTQQGYAGFLQDRAQALLHGVNSDLRGLGNAGLHTNALVQEGGGAGGRSNLHRQSTAEILLEAAGELGGANNGTASGKKDADGKNANV
eukprot:g12549.t1.1.5e17418b g12549  g12549.t1 contig6:2141272-2142327(+)